MGIYYNTLPDVADASGREISQTIESDYNGISYILKRETFHQS